MHHQEILKRYHISAKKSLGQNFLVNDEILQKISSFYAVGGKNIVEVGPGYGALTEKILNNIPASLTLVELDPDMEKILLDREALGELQTQDIAYKIIRQDILKTEIDYEDYQVIANIPYYITSPILRHFLYDIKNKPEKMLILMQDDVADKIISKKSSVLSLFVAKKCKVEKIIFVPRKSFIPAPKVESSVLAFELHDNFSHIDDEKFMTVIKKGFLAPRKKLMKNLVSGGFEKEKVLQIFAELDIEENARGESLTVEEWCELVEKL